MVSFQQFNICIMEAAAGSKSESPTSTLQNRVRGVLRRGFQWKWDRDSGNTNTKESEWNGGSSQGYETAGSTSQKRWQHFAPVAVQKFRRLFSSDGANNVCSEECTNIGLKPKEPPLTQCSASPDTNTNVRSVADMVRMKTQDKGQTQGEKGKLSEPRRESSSPGSAVPLPTVSTEDLKLSESIQSLAKRPEQLSLCLPSARSLSNLEIGFPVNKSDNQLNPNFEQNFNQEIKACDKEHISADHNCSSDNKAIDCDEEKNESFKVALAPGSQHKVMELSGTEELFSTMKCSTTPSIKESTLECTTEKISIPLELQDPTGSTNPSIVLSTMDSGKTPNHPSKKSLEPLYLTLDSTGAAASHTRKSPVTVQEWVDSIPLTSHLEEDPEDGSANEDVLLTVAESQEIGDTCPSLQVRPASGQSGTVADQRREAFSRDASPSLQSDTGSHGSSVDSYLEARRPDPEEVLLGLGFGGPLHNTEAEVSRIPARFLQPSKVKGVAIDDFLRYQQDLIETFESGYSGYRGLTGGAQIPSVIVAKIMEKLREHERESSVKSSAGSSPGHHADLSKRRFSRAAQRITILTKMKSRDSIASGPQAHSVLNPDNRKFLDNQGSKSPEVSRKRMIIGHRSFTFDGEGQLIESEPNAENAPIPEVTVPSKPPLPRPLVHKDSVLSSATSLTSYDSDSDTDEASGGERNNGTNHHGLQRLLSAPVTCGTGSAIPTSTAMVNAAHENDCNASEKRRRSLPSASDLLFIELSSNRPDQAAFDTIDNSLNMRNSAQVLQTSTPEKGRSWRDLHRINSAPTISPVLSNAFSILGTHKEESYPTASEKARTSEIIMEHVKGTIAEEREKLPSAVTRPPKSNGNEGYEKVSPSTLCKPSFYQITDFALPGEPLAPPQSPESQNSSSVDSHYNQELQRFYSLPKASAMYLDQETRRKLSLQSSVDSFNVGSAPQTPDLKHWSTSSVSSWESERDHLINTGGDEISDQDQGSAFEPLSPTSCIKESESDINSASSRRRGSLKRQQNIDVEDTSVGILPVANLAVDISKVAADKGDSFEMEELAVEDEARGTRTGSAHSDSSGFQEEHNHNKEMSMRPGLGKQLSESEPMLSTQLFPDEPIYTAEHLKRLSLPVIRVQDESGLTQWQASSFGRGSIPFSTPLRRVRSMPSQISRIGLGRLCDSISPGSIADSIGNMFSSCSDESVIHLPHPSIDVTSGSDQPDFLSLPDAIKDYEGESDARRLAKDCCECNCELKKSLAKCHNDLQRSGVKSETLSNISRGLETMKEAQNRIKNVMEQLRTHLCSSSECSMSTAVDQVAFVVQQQSSLCLQLEQFNLDLLSTVRNSSVKNAHDFTNFSQYSCSEEKDLPKGDLSQHHDSNDKCTLLCQVIEKENKRLQDLVRLNVDELAQVRILLEKILPNIKQ